MLMKQLTSSSAFSVITLSGKLEGVPTCFMPTLVFTSPFPFSWSNMMTSLLRETPLPPAPASCLPGHTCASPIFHCTCSTGGLHTPELCSDSIAHPDERSGQEESLSPRGLCPGVLHSPGPGSHLSPELTWGAGERSLPVERSRRPKLPAKSLFPISEDFSSCKKERLNGDDRSYVLSLLLYPVSPLSPLPALLWLLSISQTLKEGNEKSSDLRGCRECAVTQREGGK